MRCNASALEPGLQIRSRVVRRESNADPRCMHLQRDRHGPRCIESAPIGSTSAVIAPTTRHPFIKNGRSLSREQREPTPGAYTPI